MTIDVGERITGRQYVEALLPWIGTPGFDLRAPGAKYILFPYSGFKTSYQIASLFDRYIDMDERLPWNPDGPIVIIARASKAACPTNKIA